MTTNELTSPEAAEAAVLIRTQAAEIERLKQGMVDVATSLNKTAEYQVAELLSEIDQLRVALQKVRHDTPAPQRFTVCDECGRNDLPAGDAVWVDDGASYCKTCRTLTQPAPPAEPAGDALRELREAAADVLAQVAFVPVKHPGHTHQRDRLRAALAAAPAQIQPTPQPDAEEREAMVYLIECTLQEHPAQHESAWYRAHYVADALLAAGWTRKQEEG